MALEIARAGPADAATVALLGRLTFVETFGYLFRDHPGDLGCYLDATFGVPKIRRSLSKAANCYWLASWSELPVGYAKLKGDSPVPGQPGQRASQLQKIYVLRGFLGRGIGQALLGFVLREAAERAPLMWLDVLRENERAIRFYERHGFGPAGEDTYQIGAQSFRFHLMARQAA